MNGGLTERLARASATRPWRTVAAWVAAVVVALAAVVLFLVAPTYPNYDAYYHLVWGRELLDGVTPTFEAYKAPTQHPLELAVAAVLGAAFGGWADRAVVLVAVLSLVALVWAVYRLGARVFGVWPGLAGA
ncbi:MAG: hypothetical protein M3123_00055, partial [Actinomycetota bacterium]|nr:hypothetical protein [Actinomycetota bacterium]